MLQILKKRAQIKNEIFEKSKCNKNVKIKNRTEKIIIIIRFFGSIGEQKLK